ncbi:MAG TPA: hypothetical protein VF198_18940 [Vicinamibacterales bacterium]
MSRPAPARRPFALLASLLLAVVVAGCAPRGLRLPDGPSRPLPDPDAVLSAIGHCAAVRSLTAEVGLSGRVGRERLRGRLLVGLAAPASVRIEAVAPFGAPYFLLAGREGVATLLFPREDHVLPEAPVAEILEALAGLDVGASELRAWLAGCPGSEPQPDTARAYGEAWAAVDLAESGTAWFRRLDRGWRLIARTGGELRVEFDGHAGAQPLEVRIGRASPQAETPLDVRLALRQIEINVDLPANAFAIDVPAGAIAITLEELRRSGPLRDDVD